MQKSRCASCGKPLYNFPVGAICGECEIERARTKKARKPRAAAPSSQYDLTFNTAAAIYRKRKGGPAA